MVIMFRKNDLGVGVVGAGGGDGTFEANTPEKFNKPFGEDSAVATLGTSFVFLAGWVSEVYFAIDKALVG